MRPFWHIQKGLEEVMWSQNQMLNEMPQNEKESAIVISRYELFYGNIYCIEMKKILSENEKELELKSLENCG